MSAELPSPQEIRESRRQALLQKHADGGRLTAEQLAEIEDLISTKKKLSKTGSTPKSAPSMTSAEKMWGIDKSELSRAKNSGCAAFRGNLIYRDDLLAWLQANPAAAGDVAPGDYKARKLKAQVDKLEIDVSRERGKLVERAIVTEEWGKHITRLFDIVNQSCPRDMAQIITKEFRGYLGKAAKDL